MEEIMRRAENMQDALEIVGDSDIGEYLLSQPVKTFDDVDTHLWLYMGECLKRFGGSTIPPEMSRIVDLYVEKYDVLNIRIKLRMMLKNATSSLVPLGVVYNREYLEKMADAQEMDDVYEILAKCNLGDYIRIMENSSIKDARSASEGEARLQDHYYRKLLNIFKHMTDGQLLVQVFESIIDMANLQTIFRLSLEGDYAGDAPVLSGGRSLSEGIIKELLALKMTEITGKLENTGYHAMARDISKEYEKDGNITIVDIITERHRFQMLKDLLSPRVLSASSMVWYLLIKEREIRNLRLIFRMLTDGIPAETIRELVIAA